MEIVPNSILGKSHGYTAPSDKLNIAVAGIGGMGITNIQHVFETETGYNIWYRITLFCCAYRTGLD